MTLRDQVEQELRGAVEEHERIRRALKGIDTLHPDAGAHTLEVRHGLMAINARYAGIRALLAAQTQCGMLEPRTAQEPVERLELFAPRGGARSLPYHDRQMAAAGDHTTEDESGVGP